MNTKRWVAVVCALLIMGGSFLANSFFPKKEIRDYSGLTNQIRSVFYEDDSESIITKGDSENRILVVRIEGAIGRDSSSSKGYNHRLTLDALERAYGDYGIKGIILLVDSPGGGVYESAEVKNAIVAIKNTLEIPVYAVFGSMAASGGYYVSAYSDKIYAGEETWTGSIGVIMSSYDVSELMSNLGIKPVVIKSAAHKDIMSSSRPMTAEEMKYMQELIDNAFSRFVKVVSEGRKLSESEVRKFADGRIFDSVKAKDLKLIDEIGSFEDAVADMENRLGLSGCEVFEMVAPLGGIRSLFYSITEFNVGNLKEAYSEFSRPKLLYMFGE